MDESKKLTTPSQKIVGSTQTKNREIVILRGITTSQINKAPKAKNPYPARVFLKVDNQDQDTPVFFRIKYEKDSCQYHYGCPWYCNEEKSGWIKPKIKTGSYLEVKGFFDNPKNGSSRKSFTALSYQILTSHQAKVETYAR